MILYDKDKLLKYGNDHCLQVIDILSYITYKPLPKSRRDIKTLKYQSINWRGESFLVRPEGLINNWWRYSDKEVLQYVLAASRRRITDYFIYGKITLDTIEVNTKPLENNRLLSITGDEIHFKFEEK